MSNEQIELQNKLSDPKRRVAIDTYYAIKRVGHRRWEIIAKNMNADAEIWTALFNQGKNLQNTDAPTFVETAIYCGENAYVQIRPQLIEHGLILNSQNVSNMNVSEEKKKTKKQPRISKADMIRQQNIINKMKEEMDNLALIIKATNGTEFNPKDSIRGGVITLTPEFNRRPNFKAKFKEFIMVKMMNHSKILIKHYQDSVFKLDTLKSNKHIHRNDISFLENYISSIDKDITELIIGFHKIVCERRNDQNISKTCLADFTDWIEYAKKVVNFKPDQVILYRPELIFKTMYDNMLGKKLFSMYPSQQEIFKFITTTNSYLALVHTMLGSGKTSMVVPLCGWLIEQRRASADNKTKIIFCCPNEAVLLEVGNMIYGLAVPFGIVVYNKDTHLLDYKWSTFVEINRKEKDPRKRNNLAKQSAILYLCDIFVARKLLEERQNNIREHKLYMESHKEDPVNYPLTEKRIPKIPEYILIGDELTENADTQKNYQIGNVKFSLTTEVFVDLMRLAPSQIILMSATLPTISQLSDFYQTIVNQHPDMVIKSFSSVEAKIGCALISVHGELYAPHSGVKTIDEVMRVLNVIKTNPFIGRFYTFEVLLQMVDDYNKNGLSVPDLTKMFEDPTKANQTNIQKIAYDMLQTLIDTGSDEIVQKTCCTIRKTSSGINLSTILTSDIGRFNKGCLVFSSDPVKTAYQVYRANFDKFITSDTDRNIFQQVRLDKILDEYNKLKELHQKAIKRIEDKLDDGANEANKKTDSKERIQPESWKVLSTMSEDKPIWKFPPCLQLCSKEHLKKSGCQNTHIVSSGTIGPEDLPSNSSVSMDILMMLASGIGIYTVNDSTLDDIYLKTVLYLAKQGLVKIIFTDGSIAYGTNLAVSDIIIIDEPCLRMEQNEQSIIDVQSDSNLLSTESIVDKHSMKTIFQMLGRAGRGGNLSYEARIYTTSVDNKLIKMIQSYIAGTLDEGNKDEVQNIRHAFKIIWRNV